MRTKLKEFENKRMSFIGQFEKYGSTMKYGKHIYGDVTILLKKVANYHTQEIVTTHIWITVKGTSLEDIYLKRGDFIKFKATVKPYIKGYKGNRIDLIMKNPKSIDYQLSDIGKIEILNEKIIL